MPQQSTASNPRAQLESILFAAGRPVKLRDLAELTSLTVADVERELDALQASYLAGGHGLELIRPSGEAGLATHPGNSHLVQGFLRQETAGELTRPQLEALAVIAYRGPISKAELELVRGVNCSLILRNLMIRGLTQLEDEASPVPRFQVTVDFLAHLGLASVRELPNFGELSQSEVVAQAAAPPEAAA